MNFSLCSNKSQRLGKKKPHLFTVGRTDLLKSFSSVPLFCLYDIYIYKQGCTTKMVSVDYIYIFLIHKAKKIIDVISL